MKKHGPSTTFIALGDLHLYPGAAPVEKAVAIFEEIALRSRTGESMRLVLTGDIFDFSMASRDEAKTCAENAILAIEQLDDQVPAFLDGIYQIIEAGGQVIFLFGNHDAEMFLPAVQMALIQRLHLRGPALHENPLLLSMPGWFYRPSDVPIHFEHGNQYDPDNAVPHPLAIAADSGHMSTSPLGILLTRHFSAQFDDINFSLKVDQSAFVQIWNVVGRHKKRVPALVKGFARAVGICKLHARRNQKIDEETRNVLETAYSEQFDVPLETVQTVRKQMTSPTIACSQAVHQRLYLDEVFLTLGLVLLGILWLCTSNLGVEISTVAFLVFSFLVFKGHRRSRNKIHTSQRLCDAGKALGTSTHAQYVVMGHAHIDHEEGAYVNTGSLCHPHTFHQASFLEMTYREGKVEMMRRICPPANAVVRGFDFEQTEEIIPMM